MSKRRASYAGRRRQIPPGFREIRMSSGRVVYQAVDPAVVRIHKDVQRTYGPVTTKSAIECVRAHMCNRFFVQLDLACAFDSVDAFGLEVYTDISLDHLWRYFFHTDGGLIQGAPSSPLLFELYCRSAIDDLLAQYCKHRGITWTRYVDDVVLSANRPFGRRSKKQLRRLVSTAGFTINETKYRVVDTYLEHPQPFVVLGVCLSRGQAFLPPEYSDRIECARTAAVTARGLEAYRDARNRLRGLLRWSRSVKGLNRPYTKS